MSKRGLPGEPIYTVELDVLGLLSLLIRPTKAHRNVIREPIGEVEIQITKPVAERIKKVFAEKITFRAMSRSGRKMRLVENKTQVYYEFRSFFKFNEVAATLFFKHAQDSRIHMAPLKEGGELTPHLVVGLEKKTRPEYWLGGHEASVRHILECCL
jgi:hypothetical protein